VFEDVRQIGPPAQPLEESAAFSDAAAVLDERRQPGHQAVVETGDGVRGPVFPGSQIDPGFDYGKIRPDVRTTERQYFADFHCGLVVEGT
jgi:hypothetical protein